MKVLGAHLGGAQDLRARIAAITGWLRAGHGYTTTPAAPPAGTDPVSNFLFTAREGHCEYFASAAVLLLRAAGIPARYVTGFRGGEWNALGHYVAVRGDRAHAWAEAFLPDAGWMRVDATPPGAPLAAPGRMSQVGDALEFLWSRWIVGYDLGRQRALVHRAWQGVIGRGAGGAIPRAGFALAGLAAFGLLFVAGSRLRRAWQAARARRARRVRGAALRPRGRPRMTRSSACTGGRRTACAGAVGRGSRTRRPTNTPAACARAALCPTAGAFQMLTDRVCRRPVRGPRRGPAGGRGAAAVAGQRVVSGPARRTALILRAAGLPKWQSGRRPLARAAPRPGCPCPAGALERASSLHRQPVQKVEEVASPMLQRKYLRFALAVSAFLICASARQAAAQLGTGGSSLLTGSGGTTGAASFATTDFFVGVQAQKGVNLTTFDSARFFNIARCECDTPVYHLRFAAAERLREAGSDHRQRRQHRDDLRLVSARDAATTISAANPHSAAARSRPNRC